MVDGMKSRSEVVTSLRAGEETLVGKELEKRNIERSNCFESCED